jgi:hypothetical protein
VKREANSFPNTSCAVPVTRRKREAPERRPKNAIVEQIGAALGCVLIWFFALLCLVGSRKFNEPSPIGSKPRFGSWCNPIVGDSS